MKQSHNIALILAGGTGERMHASVPKQFMETGVLLSMSFHKVVDNEAQFIVSVGSPDENNEEFFYALMVLDNFGKTRAEVFNDLEEDIR